MALFVIERNLAKQLQRSRDAARRVTEINRDIGVVMHNPVRRRECLRLAVAAGLVALPAAAAEPYPSKPSRIVVPFGGSDCVGLPHPSRRTRASAKCIKPALPACWLRNSATTGTPRFAKAFERTCAARHRGLGEESCPPA